MATNARAVPAPTPARSGRATRRAMVGLFAVNGVLLTSWFTRIPAVKAQLGLSDAQLGLALLCPTVGALVGLQFTGRLTSRYGSGPVCRVAAVLVPVSLAAAAASRNLLQLVALLAVFGVADGVMDVAQNAHGVAVERALDRPLLSGFHAAWSIGGIVGSALGGAAAAAGWGLQRHFAVLAAVAVSAQLLAGHWLLPADVDRRRAAPPADAPDRAAGWRSGWTRPVVVLGLLAFCCLLSETAIANWSAVFLTDARGASSGLAAVGYLAFSVMMAAGRLAGDTARRVLGPAVVVRVGALVGGTGLLLALAVPAWPAGVSGFGLFGLGLSALMPLILSAAGHGAAGDPSGPSATTAVARVSMLSYLGILVGPPLIGAVAELTGLTWALALPLALLALVALNAPVTGTPPRGVAAAPRSGGAVT